MPAERKSLEAGRPRLGMDLYRRGLPLLQLLMLRRGTFVCLRPTTFSLLFFLLLFSSAVFPGGLRAAEPDSALSNRLRGIDLEGKLHRLGQKSDCRGVVVVFLSTQCPISNSYLPALNHLASEWRRQHVECYGVISDASVTRTAAREHRRKYRIHFPVLFDASEELRTQLKATHTPHGFVLDRRLSIVYDGCVDDRYPKLGRKKLKAQQHYLRDAVSAMLAGLPISIKKTQPVGCVLEDPARTTTADQVTFTRDVAPIIQAHCVTCHRPDESAPFSLLTYENVSAHAGQICAVTNSRLMPPWKAAANFGHFRDERLLSQAEITLMKSWVAAGKPRGNPLDLLPSPTYTKGWGLGKPDLILEMTKPFQIRAAGEDIYQHFVIPTRVRRNRLISAVEFRPGTPRVVHHASFYFDTTGEARRLDASTQEYGYHNFGGPGFLSAGGLRSWIPGQTPRFLPKGTGRWLPKHSDLVLQVHYQCSGKPESDQSKVGLFFAPSRDRQPVAELQVLNADLNIPPGADRHVHHATYITPCNMILLDVAPHMHLLGREIKSTATLPSGKIVPLIWIKEWDFSWQGQYVFQRPIRLPKGSRIDVKCVFDNSADNPLNPSSPPVHVKWGEQTKDEMGICHFQFTTNNIRDFWTVNEHHLKYLQNQHAKRRK